LSDWDETTSVCEATDVTSSEQHERDRAYLIVLAGSHVGEMFKITRGEVVIGRGRRADVRLIDEGVSRLHAKIRVDGEKLFVDDLGSRNGTYVNGSQIKQQVLADGDKIQVGRTTILKFTYHDEFDESFQRQMYDSALRDSLTGTYNKRYFTDRLENEFRFALRHSTPLTLMLLDLDHFKKVNDTYGHPAGDHVLIEFAKAVAASIRNEDVFARYGGEEFAIISRSIPLAVATKVAERIRSLVERMDPEYDGQVIPVTTSIGVASVDEMRAEEPEDMVTAADRALYWAKAQGRNRVSVFDDNIADEDTRPS
jgi:diguanylate cyclase (GGDEF)-like protein